MKYLFSVPVDEHEFLDELERARTRVFMYKDEIDLENLFQFLDGVKDFLYTIHNECCSQEDFDRVESEHSKMKDAHDDLRLKVKDFVNILPRKWGF